MSPKFCVYCGSAVKDKDRFCIICGKPRLTDESPSEEGKSPGGDPKAVKDDTPEEEKSDSGSKMTSKEKELKEKKDKEIKESIRLPDDVKEYYDLKLKKKVLLKKLEKIQKDMKGSRYETDAKVKASINLKLKAVKSLVVDLKKKEVELSKSVDPKHDLDKLYKRIEKKREELSNITREKKLRKIDKDTFQNLKEIYKTELIQLETNKADLIIGLKSWKYELERKKTTLITKKKLHEGRFKAKELTDEKAFKEKDSLYASKLKNLKVKIDVLKDIIE